VTTGWRDPSRGFSPEKRASSSSTDDKDKQIYTQQVGADEGGRKTNAVSVSGALVGLRKLGPTYALLSEEAGEFVIYGRGSPVASSLPQGTCFLRPRFSEKFPSALGEVGVAEVETEKIHARLLDGTHPVLSTATGIDTH